MNEIIKENSLDFLLTKVKKHNQMDFSQYKKSTLIRRINTRLKATGCTNYLSYATYLNKHRREYDQLIDAITINVSEFFRNPQVFKDLENKYIPELVKIKKAKGKKVIRAWSAGVSFGEEAYSLAILFLESLRKMAENKEPADNFDLKIYATDILLETVNKAKQGIFHPKNLQNVNKELLLRYFQKKGDSYQVADNVKNIIRFSSHNLVSDSYFKHLDIILCRNVAIYFSKGLQESVFLKFAKSLNDGGIFVLGTVESLTTVSAPNLKIIDNRKRIYKKIN